MIAVPHAGRTGYWCLQFNTLGLSQTFPGRRDRIDAHKPCNHHQGTTAISPGHPLRRCPGTSAGCGRKRMHCLWGWYAVACVDPDAWNAIVARAPDVLRRLVEGQQQAEQVWALHAARDPAGNTEGLRRLLLAIIRDLRVVYLLLARQLARMRAAAALPEAERHELAQLTRDIHAPLANRLGIGQWKWELEDLAFRYLQPDVYRRIAELLDERRADRED